MSSLYLGVDIGTSTTKGIIIDKNGTILAEKSLNRRRQGPFTNYWEDNPEKVWWNEFIEIVHGLLSDMNITKNRIACVAVTGMFYNICPASFEGIPLRNALLYPDTRARAIELQLSAELREQHYMNESLSKLVWLKTQMGQEWSKV